jgi:hypothetical protein
MRKHGFRVFAAVGNRGPLCDATLRGAPYPAALPEVCAVGVRASEFQGSTRGSTMQFGPRARIYPDISISATVRVGETTVVSSSVAVHRAAAAPRERLSPPQC